MWAASLVGHTTSDKTPTEIDRGTTRLAALKTQEFLVNLSRRVDNLSRLRREGKKRDQVLPAPAPIETELHHTMDEHHYEYDIGLSFAGEQREYVKDFARQLESRGVRVFYDDYEKAGLWGKDLYAHLALIYGDLCRYCILFASAHYAEKVWTNHERRSAQARALEENCENILPVRFDDTPIPGLLKTIHYIDLDDTSLSELVQLTLEKLGNPKRRNYLPPVLDLLYDRLDVADDPDELQRVHSQATSFFRVLQRMTPDERDAALTHLYQERSRWGADLAGRSRFWCCKGLIGRVLGGLEAKVVP